MPTLAPAPLGRYIPGRLTGPPSGYPDDDVDPEGHQYPATHRPAQVDTVYPAADPKYPGAHGSAATEADGQYRPAGQAAATYAVGDVDAAGQ